jgi:hypothetical protein
MQIDYRVIEQLQAAARRERSLEVCRLLERMALWVRARLSRGLIPTREPTCCVA